MKAHNEKSQKIVDSAVSLLCASDEQKQLLQMLYDLGVQDGKIVQLKDMLANLEAES